MITPFRRQVSVISCKISDPQIEVSTVDQFQGKDKQIGLVSFVKSFEGVEESEVVRKLYQFSPGRGKKQQILMTLRRPHFPAAKTYDISRM